MAYVIVNEKTWVPVQDKYYISAQTYKTEAAAKAQITRKGLTDTHVVMNYHKWDNERPEVPVRNLMTGKIVMEKVGTPNCCSVGSETYWCM